jgi:hypothetical protein
VKDRFNLQAKVSLNIEKGIISDMTLAQKEHEESPLRKMQSLYFTSFHETVSSSNLMDKFYERAILASGVIDLIEKSDKPITIVDVAGGRGRVGDILKKLLEERGISKSFNYVVVDISQEELGKESGKHKIVGNITQVPLANKTADVVFLVNMPSPTAAIKIHMLKKTPGVNKGSGEDSKVYSLIDNASTAMFLLDVCEGVRVLKENGVMVGGTRYGGLRTDFGGLAPLEADRFEVFRLDKGVKKLWKDYGLDVYGPEFFVETFIKKGEVKRKVS